MRCEKEENFYIFTKKIIEEYDIVTSHSQN